MFCSLGALNSQELDSLITYFVENGKKNVEAKSYWSYDADLNEMRSSYYIYSSEKRKFKHINDQIIQYFGDTRMYEIYKTIDYARARIDSTVYLYNSDQINIEKVAYAGSLDKPGELSLHRIKRYLDLDHTDRKTVELIDVIKDGEVVRSRKSKFKYSYNEKDELVEKITYSLKDSIAVPYSKQLQLFTDDGRISSVERFRYDLDTDQFTPWFLAEYVYKDKERIQTKTNYEVAPDSERRVEIQRIIYLNEEENILRKQYYLKELSPGNLYREDVYFYSE